MNEINEEFYKEYGCISKWSKFGNDTQIIELKYEDLNNEKQINGGNEINDIITSDNYFLGGNITADSYDKQINILFMELDEFEAKQINDGNYFGGNNSNDDLSGISDDDISLSSHDNLSIISDNDLFSTENDSFNGGNTNTLINNIDSIDNLIETTDEFALKEELQHPSNETVENRNINDNVNYFDDVDPDQQIMNNLIEMGYIDEDDMSDDNSVENNNDENTNDKNTNYKNNNDENKDDENANDENTNDKNKDDENNNDKNTNDSIESAIEDCE